MEINTKIREQVIADLKSGLLTDSGDPMVTTFFDGLPAYIEVAEQEGYEGDIPAVSVSLADGTATDEDFDEVTWQAVLNIRVYLVADNATDPELDKFGKEILKIITRHYTANGLLSQCNRTSYDYGRDDEQPWGTLDLAFTVEYCEEA